MTTGDDWMENDVLLALDDELEGPMPWWDQWELDLADGYDMEKVRPELWSLDDLSFEQWAERVEHRRSVLERLLRGDVPRVIVVEQMRLLAKARAALHWHAYKRFTDALRSIDEGR